MPSYEFPLYSRVRQEVEDLPVNSQQEGQELSDADASGSMSSMGVPLKRIIFDSGNSFSVNFVSLNFIFQPDGLHSSDSLPTTSFRVSPVSEQRIQVFPSFSRCFHSISNVFIFLPFGKRILFNSHLERI